MDGRRFDALARAVSATSRRRLLGRLAGSVLGVGIADLGLREATAQEAEAPCKRVGKPCARNGQCCTRRCVGVGPGGQTNKRCLCPEGREPCRTRCCGRLQGCNAQRRCVPHCQDGKQSGNESDLDCGGRCRKKCDTGFKCRTIGDCDSGICFDHDGDGQKHCAACIDDLDCTNPRFPFCDGLFCVQCRAAADCADEAGEPFCREGFCRECLEDAHCPNATAPFCDSTGVCDACREDEHCPGGTFCEFGQCVGCPAPEAGRIAPAACVVTCTDEGGLCFNDARFRCCDGACTRVDNDVNCGGCGTCADRFGPGHVCCGACVKLELDEFCGSCDNSCREFPSPAGCTNCCNGTCSGVPGPFGCVCP